MDGNQEYLDIEWLWKTTDIKKLEAFLEASGVIAAEEVKEKE